MIALWLLCWLSVVGIAGDERLAVNRTLKPGEYSNFSPASLARGNWQGYDLLQVVADNTTASPVTLYVTLGDRASQDYWTKLNFKTTLAPGRNSVSFPLAQWVGESGSHRHQRGLDLRELKTWFAYIEGSAGERVVLQEFALKKSSALSAPASLKLFDFTTPELAGAAGFIKVTEKNFFHSSAEFGFADGTRFWRSEDSMHGPQSLRASIGVLDGRFQFRIPDGDYEAELVWDRLGYWDPSFWRKRSLSINGKMVALETRGASDYLADLFRFAEVGDSSGSPLGKWLSLLFPPRRLRFTVKGGVAELSLSGTETGVSLNRLVVWPLQDRSQAEAYLSRLRSADEKEWSQTTRAINVTKARSDLRPSVVTPAPRLTAAGLPPKGQELWFTGGVGHRASQLIQLPPGDVRFVFSELTHSSGQKVHAGFEIFYLRPQYSSADMNHETFERVSKLTQRISGQVQLTSTGAHFFWIELPLSEKLKTGRWQGSLTVELNGRKTIFPIKVNRQDYRLPPVSIAAGFFGLNNLPPNYFGTEALAKYRLQVNRSALELLARYGFTSFSGLSEPRGEEFKKTMQLARQYNMRAAYTYGGEAQAVLNRLEVSQAEIAAFTQGSPQLIHTFSDEAEGYQSRLAQDRQLFQTLRAKYPQLKLAGFGHMGEESSEDFYRSLDVGFYTKADDWKANLWAKRGHQWGAYNGAVGNFADPRFSFGVGLYLAESRGLSHYLEWQAVNNYPHLEVDGRECDVAAWLPELNGEVSPTLRFLLAAEGLATYRKLHALGLRAKNDKKSAQWLESLHTRYRVFLTPRLLSGVPYQHEPFVKELDQLLN